MHGIPRRHFLGLAAAFAAAQAVLPRAARAIAPAEAEKLVTEVANEIQALIATKVSTAEQARRFRTIFERTAATPQITRFVMGRAWRDMTPAQQDAFRDAFLDYVSRVYVNILSDYRGDTVEVTNSQDLGQKGVLVHSLLRAPGKENTKVEWLVSDRGGDGLRLVDLVVEGVSLLQTQRQEFASMLDKRGGDVDRLIADLKNGEVGSG